jgi:hypothetical protein
MTSSAAIPLNTNSRDMSRRSDSAVAGGSIAKRDREKCDRDRDKYKIKHTAHPSVMNQARKSHLCCRT